MEHVDAAPFISMRSASSVKSSAYICGKKLHRVALALVDLLWDWTLPKVPTISKNAAN